MIHDYRELLTAPARARMLPEQILTRMAELEATYPEIANASHPSAVVAEARRGVAECLGLAAIPRTEPPEWQVLAELPGEGFTIEKGTFDNRSDRHLTRTPLLLDSEGFARLSKLMDELLETILEEQAASAARRKESGEEPIHAVAATALFAMPKPTGRTGPEATREA